ncbi:uncharacterized protein LOC117175378 [Belonocnema kinseyi]|uniref:uncharacterized protein LOC117175378 n=1 Tax=Belonocnema kinseyi TaxID=2817044 RepID=UPI00143DD855|nr:uncharacterized protein LOC117175378 [Belonocnema kinseyi]
MEFEKEIGNSPTEVLKYFDKNEDGGLDFEEFRTLCAKLFGSEEVEENGSRVRDIFEILDLNGDGLLNGEEWESCGEYWRGDCGWPGEWRPVLERAGLLTKTATMTTSASLLGRGEPFVPSWAEAALPRLSGAGSLLVRARYGFSSQEGVQLGHGLRRVSAAVPWWQRGETPSSFGTGRPRLDFPARSLHRRWRRAQKLVLVYDDDIVIIVVGRAKALAGRGGTRRRSFVTPGVILAARRSGGRGRGPDEVDLQGIGKENYRSNDSLGSAVRGGGGGRTNACLCLHAPAFMSDGREAGRPAIDAVLSATRFADGGARRLPGPSLPLAVVLKEEARLFDTVLFLESKLEQRLWPVHCIMNSWGAQLHKDLYIVPGSEQVRKGQNPDMETYSAFFDNNSINSTELLDILKKNNVTDVYVCGLAYDVCVRATCLDGLKLGYRLVAIEDCCRGVDQDDIAITRKEISENGGLIVNSSEVLSLVNDKKRSLIMAQQGASALAKKSLDQELMKNNAKK